MAAPKKGNLGISEIIGDKRDAVLKLAEQYGASNVRVFGSVARGEAREDSDVDFLVQFRKGTSIFELAGLRLDLIDLLGRDIDLVPDDSLKRHVQSWALRDAKPL